MIREFLDGEPEDRIARKLGLPRERADRMMAAATGKLTHALEPAGPSGPDSCAVPGCDIPVGSRRPSLPDLRPFCDLHRQMRVFGISHVEPDRAVAASLASSDAFEAGYVDVTPALAFALLERNTNNRGLSRDRVERYARDMASGDWRPNNQGIAIGADGLLYDGQHRLWSILKSGCTVRLLVVRGLPAATRSTIDQGRPRNVGDTMRILDGRANGARIVSWLRAIEVMTSGRPASMSHAVARRALDEFDPSVRWFLDNGPRAAPYSRAPVVGALVYARTVLREPVESFTRRYVSGAQLEEDSPVLALRSYVAERMQRDTESPRAISLRTLRCLLAEMRGEHLERVPASEAAFQHFRELHAAAGRQQ